jgi:5-methylthioribose kinase
VREVTPETAGDYLRERGYAPPGAAVVAHTLGWGVSNVVMLVEIEGRPALVLKQSRERLRTKMRWESRLDRVWTEADALRILAPILPPGAVPEIVFEDRANYLFAMTRAPEDSAVWKEQLLEGVADASAAESSGRLLSAMHAESAARLAVSGRLADRTVFHELRIDPFYRTTLAAHPDLSEPLGRLIDEAVDPPEITFVHADFSPKNILVHRAGLTIVDFETAHAGDPAFDLGFFASHLILKTIRRFRLDGPGAEEPLLELLRTFWRAYWSGIPEPLRRDRSVRASSHAAACTLARIDGKSPVDYLDDRGQEIGRRFGRGALQTAPNEEEPLLEALAQEML